MLDELVILVPRQVGDVGEVARDEIIDRDDAMPFRQEPVGEMRSQKPRPAGDD